MRAADTNEGLVELVRRGAASYLGGRASDERVLDAMRAVDRALFLPPSEREFAYRDAPCQIGMGQTCSEPSMVAFMLQILSPRPGDRVLEVGCGCGYAAAIASILCYPDGLVVGAEIIPELAQAVRANLAAARPLRLRSPGDGSGAESLPGSPFRGPPASWTFLDAVTVLEADGSMGLPERGPWSRILVSAGVGRSGDSRRGTGGSAARSSGFREEPLLDALASDGVLVYPEERGSVYRLTKTPSGIVRDRWSGVAFVPLKGRNA